jgi:hypothetical protein
MNIYIFICIYIYIHMYSLFTLTGQLEASRKKAALVHKEKEAFISNNEVIYCIYIHMFIYVYIYMYICTYVYDMYTNKYIYVYAYIYIYMYIHMYIICIQINTYIEREGGCHR